MLGQLYSVRQTSLSIMVAASIAVGLFIAGCSSSQRFLGEEKSKSETAKEKKLPLAEYEATLHPADFDKEVEIVQKEQNEERKESAPLVIPKDSSFVQEDVLQGFRVQIFSSSSVDEANAIKSAAVS